MEFANQSLDRLETDHSFSGGFPSAVVEAFRKRMQLIRSASDKRDFYQLKSLHFEKLKGGRSGQYSMRLNDQYRLVLKLLNQSKGKVVQILEIWDHD